MERPHLPCACTIAGSDSGGGAGIQADLKTFSALGVWGCTVVTAVTAQNTRDVLSSLTVDTHTLSLQMEAVFQDFPITAVKTGMLPDAATIRTVAEHLPPEIALVLDPVMIATSGKRLSSPECSAALSDLLIPRAQLVTPNIPELCALTGRAAITTTDEMTEAGRELIATGAQAVLIKGGHLTADRSPDVYISQDETLVLDGPRYPWEVHGSGCCLAAAITAYLVRGDTLPDACRKAKVFVSAAIRTAVPALSGRRMVNPSGMVSGTREFRSR
ncbi:bifunctional hydroxymethylpyrimidine kinase/phosphomethylpyrimidine kinase [Methanogenium sp. S4BF]|uniref:bifunctional hydroxymethylpyrimidine kinase/phosphomethylpyrimidine kinase n=1 Tax=Methanogenium sp. S4BF TaxID=1789226 RepID=UPI00241699F2|nr:bifunctional hydroxymethylpyrimidine kinase/phosphomethylpyrimidine kinase [Methanogenium sp. S4BF]WFN35303.1 bifunctional hydroxymethylpyrimidine kinase/phosphomethylpyrimidine kinase [Methanogenium sp. S4BF]